MRSEPGQRKLTRDASAGPAGSSLLLLPRGQRSKVLAGIRAQQKHREDVSTGEKGVEPEPRQGEGEAASWGFLVLRGGALG